MIIPARWYAGGKGLDEFRDKMLHDRHIRELHDFPEASDLFTGVQIKGGVCYFLWDRDNEGDCKVFTHKKDVTSQPETRPLLEEGEKIFVRYNEAVSILRKVKDFHESSFAEIVSSRKPFGFNTLFHGRREDIFYGVKCYDNEGSGSIRHDEVLKNHELLKKWKVYIPCLGSGSDSFPHSILGKPFIGEPDSCCSETYLVIGPFNDELTCKNVMSYIATKFFRFLVMLRKPTQHATKSVYEFVPVQDFSRAWTDSELYAKYDLDEGEIAFIESMIKPMNLTPEN